MRRLIVMIALLAAASAASASTDVGITAASGTPRVPVGWPATVTYLVVNHGSETVRGVRVTFSTSRGVTDPSVYFGGEYCDGLVCTIAELAPGATRIAVFNATMPSSGGPLTVSAALSAPGDSNPANDSVSYVVDVADQPDLRIFPIVPERGALFQGYEAEAKKTAGVRIFADVRGATNVVVTIDFPEGTQVLAHVGSDSFTCDLAARPVVCRAPAMSKGEEQTIRLRVVLPPLYAGGNATMRAHVSSAEPDFAPATNDTSVDWSFVQLFPVTNTLDDGPGSLRAAIVAANASDCARPCVVAMRIPPPLPPSGFFAIQPLSPLPPLTFRGHIDGASEANLLERDENGPPLVMIDGAAQRNSDGFTCRNGCAMHALAVGNFAHAAIYRPNVSEGRNPDTTVWLVGMYLGLAPDGAPAPNDRGLVDFGSLLTVVSSSVIGNNRRSGVWVVNGEAIFRDNFVGVTRDGAPIPNGASGLFLPTRRPVEVRHNVIANNAHAGVALEPAQRSVVIRDNEIAHNGGEPVDYSLDGRTPNTADDSRRFPNHPEVLEARYDPAHDETRITVRVESRSTQLPPVFVPYEGRSFVEVQLYASATDRGELERLIANVNLGSLVSTQPITLTGTAVVKGDLRGRWISGITLRSHTECYTDVCRSISESSEAGDAVPVQ